MHKILLATLSLGLLTACDSGDIQENKYNVDSQGKTVKLTGHLTGINDWTESSYCVALAGFSNDSKYAVMQRALSSDSEGAQDVEITLSNVSSSINTVELVLTNRLRERIITLASINLDDYRDNLPTDTIRMDVGSIDVNLMGCMQYGIFNQACIQCHGGNGKSAGGLNLTAGNAYDNLVNVAAQNKEGETRVIPGDVENSLVWKLLNEGGENILHYNHTEVLSSQFKENLNEVRDLIRQWISSLSSTDK